jgi:hypothetical protein
MSGVGVVARFEVAEGSEAAIEQFFRDGRATVDASQPDTTVWFGFRIGPTTYGAFAWFAHEEDRQALLSAGGPKATRENAGLFVRPPTFELVDVLSDRQQSGA